MPARVRMGSKSEIFRFFNSGYAHDRNSAIFRRRASTVTRNTLIKPNYASVRQSRDRAIHNMTKKSRRRPALKPLELRSSKMHGDVFLAHYYACKLGVNRWRIDGDIRQTKTAIMDKLVIANVANAPRTRIAVTYIKPRYCSFLLQCSGAGLSHHRSANQRAAASLLL